MKLLFVTFGNKNESIFQMLQISLARQRFFLIYT